MPPDAHGDSLMLTEARQGARAAADALAGNDAACRALAARLRDAPPPFAVTCARGSSDNAATFAKYLLELRLGVVTASMGPSVTSVYGATPRMKDSLFLAVSQSGRSPDLLRLAEGARAGGAITAALVNDPGSPLAAMCQTILPLRAGPERSVAATKSVIAALATILLLAAHWRNDAALLRTAQDLPRQLDAALGLDWSAAVPVLAGADHLFVVGRGLGLAIAQEAALKLKETAGLHAEAISAAELRHGPLALAGPAFPALVFAQPDETLDGTLALAEELRRRDVPVIVAGHAPLAGTMALPGVAGMHPDAAPIALVQSFYPLADAVARARGRDPDRPPNLTKVTETV
jgi:glucosamine--fructose-6-phosphate aminotransferase (isomerizing)